MRRPSLPLDGLLEVVLLALAVHSMQTLPMRPHSPMALYAPTLLSMLAVVLFLCLQRCDLLQMLLALQLPSLWPIRTFVRLLLSLAGSVLLALFTIKPLAFGLALTLLLSLQVVANTPWMTLIGTPVLCLRALLVLPVMSLLSMRLTVVVVTVF